MAEIDDKLAAALKQARRTPMNFAFVAKGTSQGKLVVSKKPLTASEVAAAKKAAGGGTVNQAGTGRSRRAPPWKMEKFMFDAVQALVYTDGR